MQIAVFCGAFFLSGASALILETLWLRLCGLVFGNTVVSATIVLSSFMAGLAIGSGFAAFARSPRFRALRLYVILEFSIAVLGPMIVLILPVAEGWIRPLLSGLWTHVAVLNAIRGAASFAILLLPSAAMGATLPILLGDPLFAGREFRQTVGLFYGFNTLGAVIGALAGEAFLVRDFGILGTALAAGLLNCVAAAGVLTIARTKRPEPHPSIAETNKPSLHRQYLRCWRLLFVSFGTGAIFLSLEVVWFRFLRLYVFSSATGFAMMLAVALSGLGLGGISSAVIRGKKAPSMAFISNLLLAAGIAALLSYAWFPISILQHKVGSSWGDFMLDSWWEIGVLSVALMLPTAYFSGLLFPTVVAAIDGITRNRMNSGGIATLLNTVGAAIGPIVTTFIALPALGFQQTLVVSAIGYGVLALLAAEWKVITRSRPAILTTAALAGTLALVLIFFPYRRDEEHFAHARRPFEADGTYLVAKREGVADTWQLLRCDLFGQPYYCRLVTDAFSMSSTQYPNQRYMRLFAYLPLALQAQPENALLICYGCGVTADAITNDTRLKHIDVVDISKDVLDLADDYPTRNPLHDPRVTRFVEDGRFFLQVTPRRYDLITGEPPPPKVEGTVNLYTREFFQLMNARLKEGGMATFWLPIYQLTVEDARSILRGFHEAFPNAAIWASSDEEWIMMGIKGSLAPATDENKAPNLWNEPEARAGLARIGIERPEQLPALFLMDGDDIDRATGTAKPLTDWYPKRLSDTAADRKAIHAFAEPYMDATTAEKRFRSSALMSRIWPETFRYSVAPFLRVRDLLYRAAVSGGNKFALLDFFLRQTKLETPILDLLRTDATRVDVVKQCAARMNPPANEMLPDLVAGALARREIPEAIRWLKQERTTGFATQNDLLLLTYLYCVGGEVDQSEQLAATLSQEVQQDPIVKWLWGNLQAEYGFHPPR